MDLLSLKIIKLLLEKYSAAPLKRLGQNFLINSLVLEKIISAANLNRGDTVLEIGPGLGTLTQELAKRVKKVTAIEKDRKFVEILKETLADYKNVEIIEGDALKTSNEELELQTLNYKMIANLPYYITSPTIRKFLESENPPSEMILMVQKEVAQRICAWPPNMSLLAISVQFYAKAEIISYVSKGSFWPSPKVDSAILKITPLTAQINKLNANEFFFKIVKAGFSAPRKQLASNLANQLKINRPQVLEALKRASVKPEQRAETISVENWIKITEKLI